MAPAWPLASQPSTDRPLISPLTGRPLNPLSTALSHSHFFPPFFSFFLSRSATARHHSFALLLLFFSSRPFSSLLVSYYFLRCSSLSSLLFSLLFRFFCHSAFRCDRYHPAISLSAVYSTAKDSALPATRAALFAFFFYYFFISVSLSPLCLILLLLVGSPLKSVRICLYCFLPYQFAFFEIIQQRSRSSIRAWLMHGSQLAWKQRAGARGRFAVRRVSRTDDETLRWERG